MRLEAEQLKKINSKAALTETVDFTGKLRIAVFDVIIRKATKRVEAILTKLSPGKVRILGDLSLVELNVNKLQYANIGWDSYKAYLQGRQPGSEDGLNKEMTKVLFKIGTGCPARTRVFSTQEGLYISAQLVGEFKVGDSISGYIIYVKD
jgi:hypothetical protein